MKQAGIVREIDKLGRIVIPSEYRTTLGIESGDPIEILGEKDRVVLRRYVPGCVFCGTTKNLVELDGKLVCPSCVSRLNELVAQAK